MAERIIELTIAYDEEATARYLPEIAGSMSGRDDDGDPPVPPVDQLVQLFEAWLRRNLTHPLLRDCGVDVLTVDHRNRPPSSTPAASDPNADYFQGA